MKKLILKVGNLPFILIAFLFLLVSSCDDDDEPTYEPKNPNPDSSIDSIEETLTAAVENSTRTYCVV